VPVIACALAASRNDAASTCWSPESGGEATVHRCAPEVVRRMVLVPASSAQPVVGLNMLRSSISSGPPGGVGGAQGTGAGVGVGTGVGVGVIRGMGEGVSRAEALDPG